MNYELLKGSVLAGICISIGCVVYLQIGGVAGAVLFAFGLLACVHFKLPLYTGTAGFVSTRRQLGELGIILGGNLLGCLLMAIAMGYALPSIPEAAANITAKRAVLDGGQAIVLGALCGFIMTTAVKFAREKSFLPLLFGVPVFILCGFLHSIADAFYLSATPRTMLSEAGWPLLGTYLCVVLGNFIGCNLYRIVYWRLSYDPKKEESKKAELQTEKE